MILKIGLYFVIASVLYSPWIYSYLYPMELLCNTYNQKIYQAVSMNFLMYIIRYTFLGTNILLFMMMSLSLWTNKLSEDIGCMNKTRTIINILLFLSTCANLLFCTYNTSYLLACNILFFGIDTQIFIMLVIYTFIVSLILVAVIMIKYIYDIEVQ